MSLGTVPLVPELAPPGAAHPEYGGGLPPIPFPNATGDLLASIPRTWIPPTDLDGPVLDLAARASPDTDSDIAFRYHTDIPALEAVLTMPQASGQPEALANIGIRLHAFSFDPPLRLQDDRLISRIYAAPLDWAPIGTTDPSSGTDQHTYSTWTSVPLPGSGHEAPDNDTRAAGHEHTTDTGIWLTWWTSLQDESRGDPFVLVRSPHMARFGAGISIDDDLLHPDARDRTTNVTVSWQHDLGTAARGVGVTGPNPVATTGVYLARIPAHTTARILIASTNWANDTAPYPTIIPTRTTFDSAPGTRTPGPEPQGLVGPITLNATAQLVPIRTGEPWRFPDGPLVPADAGHGLLVRGELGFLAQDTLSLPPPTDPDDSAPQEQDAPGVAPALLVLTLAFVAATMRRPRPPRPSDDTPM